MSSEELVDLLVKFETKRLTFAAYKRILPGQFALQWRIGMMIDEGNAIGGFQIQTTCKQEELKAV